MKKLLALALLLISSAAYAQHYHRDHHGAHRPYANHGQWRGNYNYNWLAPAVIGGAIIYGVTRPTVIVEQPPVFVNPSQTLPPAPLGYHWEQIIDQTCNCTRTVLVAN